MNHNFFVKLLVVIVCFLLSCNNDNTEKKDFNNNQITLIFKSPPSKWRVYRKVGGYTPARCEIDYINDNYLPIQYFPNPEKEFDTLIIKTKRRFVEFRHSYKGIDKLSYLFQNGDTILFIYQNKTPIATLMNRESNYNEVNFDLFKRKILYHDDYPPYVKSMQPSFFIEDTKNLKQEYERVSKLANAKFNKDISKERTFLDSIHNSKLISNEIYNLFYIQTIYQQKILELQNLKGKLQPYQDFIPKLTNENFNIQLKYDKELGNISCENLLDSKNDSLIYFGYYQGLIDWIYYNYLCKKVNLINTTNYVNGASTAGSRLPDYLALYDTINDCKLLSRQTINILKLKAIQGIIENNSIEESKVALNRFRKDVSNDTLWLSFIKNKYMLPDDTSKYSYNLKLVSVNSERINYNELIKRYNGNVIYVDFWSSGCAPCVKQFKFSAELKKHYKGQNFVQIYISIEPTRKSWNKACENNKILNESYFAENIYSSQQFDNMNIKYVPHYYLYDKKGALIDDFAPRPSDEKLIKLIDKYLSD